MSHSPVEAPVNPGATTAAPAHAAPTHTTPAQTVPAGSELRRGATSRQRGGLPRLDARQLVAPLALAAILFVFTLLSDQFLRADNLAAVLNQSALLALAAVAMTLVVRAGGIDLSLGVAIDLSALAAAALIADGYYAWVAIAGGLVFGAVVGLVNALLIVGLRIPPFLATLSVWFVGTSVQQLLTGGGAPIYLSGPRVPAEFAFLGGTGLVAGVPVAIAAALAVAVLGWALLETTRFGRALTAAGEQPRAAAIAGRRVGALTFSAYVIASLLAAVAGVLLAARTNGFVPASGQLYVLDAIGAVFIGATLSRIGRPSVPGTLVGVLIFALLANGMNLIGLSFFWQGLGRGVALLLILLAGVVLAREGAGGPLRRLLGPARR
ncbi:branched-chain amino acid ABC transporter permease [Zafaria cholistanensis]|uniref:Branched-chain amino acid ABC transporter permease n=1 Tax=Zafaria cholistanensis TaxID=1682741 RepID=A0A5A7NTA3_9MICC|nr:ABC transporter permease [Zafaria cholistanensis]GER24110.1 branched-chain amino acid ABC transporter permease [Zafaria cholistanensis]